MSEPQSSVFCLGVSHKTAALELRERFYMSSEEILIQLTRARQHGLDELVILSTCNRLELIGTAPLSWLSGDSPYRLLETLLGRDRGALPPDWRAATFLLIGNAAVQHAFSVAASLDSMIVGETQITGQFKTAFDLAEQAGSLGSILTRLKQEALATTKKVRTKTTIGEKPVSISHAAIELASIVFGELSQHSIAVLGAGEMARVASQHLLGHDVRELYIVNRTMERAEKLCATLGRGQPWSLESIEALLSRIDVVVSATASPDIVLSRELIERMQRQRSGRDLFLIDIAVPRDIEASCADCEGVYLFDVDDLQQVVDKNVEARRDAAVDAEKIVASGVVAFETWQGTLAVKPALAEFRSYLNDLMAKETERSLRKKVLASLDKEQQQAIHQLLTSIANKLSADASRGVTQAPQNLARSQLAAALTTLFRPPSEPWQREGGSATELPTKEGCYDQDRDEGQQAGSMASRVRR